MSSSLVLAMNRLWSLVTVSHYLCQHDGAKHHCNGAKVVG
jgi:hypothetical protein